MKRILYSPVTISIFAMIVTGLMCKAMKSEFKTIDHSKTRTELLKEGAYSETLISLDDYKLIKDDSVRKVKYLLYKPRRPMPNFKDDSR